MDSFDSFFIEKILFVRYGEKKLFLRCAIFRHIKQRDYSCSYSDKYFGQLGALKYKITEHSFDSDFVTYLYFSDHCATSAMLGKLDRENEHSSFVVRVLIDDGIASLKWTLVVFKKKKCPLPRKDFYFLICFNGEFHDVFCQHLTVDDLGFDGFLNHDI